MKLEAKLASTYGILLVATLVTSSVAYLHMSRVNRITQKVMTERLPALTIDRDDRLSLGKAARNLEDSVLFDSDVAAVENYRKQYR